MKKYKIYVHDFEETVEIPIGEFDMVEDAKDAIWDFHQNGKFPVVFNGAFFMCTHTFEELQRGARVKVEDPDTGEILCLV